MKDAEWDSEAEPSSAFQLLEEGMPVKNPSATTLGFECDTCDSDSGHDAAHQDGNFIAWLRRWARLDEDTIGCWIWLLDTALQPQWPEGFQARSWYVRRAQLSPDVQLYSCTMVYSWHGP